MTKKTAVATSIDYQSGFANHFASEAEPGTLPVGQNSPQEVAYGLYAEQLSGTSFMTCRAENQRSWLYRIRPSVIHGAYTERSHPLFLGRPFKTTATPEQMRWSPIDIPDEPLDFLDGIVTIAGNGDFASIRGCAVHIYRANRSMEKRFFLNADGEMLIVPELGGLHLRTEFGTMYLFPGEI